MQLAHAPSAITFPVRISPHVSEAELGPNHPIYIPKLACAKYLGMSISSPYPTSAPTGDFSY